MPGSIGGFPVHNYGSDPLGKMGLQMLQSNLDWSEKQKLLERQALQEAAKRQEGAFMETAKAGTAPRGVASQLYGPDIGQGIEAMSQQKQVMNYLQELNQTADLSKKQQDYQSAEYNKTMTSLEYWQKKKAELFEAGQDVTPINDNLDVLSKKLTQMTGLQFDAVRMTDATEIKKFKEDAAIKQVSDLETKLTQAMASGDLQTAAGAASALGAQIMSSSKRLGVSKDTFAAANETLKQFQQEMPKMLAEKVKPKKETEQKTEFRDLGGEVGKFVDGELVQKYPKTPTPKSPEDMDKVFEKRDTKIINDAHREAVTRTRMKFGSDVEITVENGQPKIAFKSQGEASDFYDKTFNELKQAKRQRAIQLKLLSPEYLEDARAPRKEVAAPGVKGRKLDEATAKFILENAGGDKELARKMAREQGFVF